MTGAGRYKGAREVHLTDHKKEREQGSGEAEEAASLSEWMFASGISRFSAAPTGKGAGGFGIGC